VYKIATNVKLVAAAALLVVTACHGGPSSAGFTPTAASAGMMGFGGAAAPKLKLSASSVTFDATGPAAAKTITATETGYTGKFTQKNTCKGIVTISPATGKGPKAIFTMKPEKAGSCKITVSDSAKHSASAALKVKPVNPTVKPTSLSFDTTGTSALQSLTISQSKFKGTFTTTSTCSGIATLSPTKVKGPSGKSKVTPTNAGKCDITVSNGAGGSTKVPVTVTTSGIVIQ